MSLVRKLSIVFALVLGVALAASIVTTARSSGIPGQRSTWSTEATPVALTAQVRHHRFRGRIMHVDDHGHSFRMRTRTHDSVRIHTDTSTRWSGCAWQDLHDGHAVDVRAHRRHGRWIATMMQNWRGHEDDDHHGDVGHHDGDDHRGSGHHHGMG